MRLFVLARHAHSTLNLAGKVNGDPAVPVDLTEQGVEQARLLGEQVRNVPLALCVHTRFSRTRRTAEVALAGRAVPFAEEPLLDDIDVGDLEGLSIGEYRNWKRQHTRADAFPGGESLDAAALRYSRAYRRLLARSEPVTLVVCHEIPIRYAMNAAAGSGQLDSPIHDVANATPFLLNDEALARAAELIERLAEATPA